jgi:hypothetical protein
MKQGVNLINYVMDKKRKTKKTKNYEIIVNEDSDVSEERAKVMNLSYRVNWIIKEIKLNFFLLG